MMGCNLDEKKLVDELKATMVSSLAITPTFKTMYVNGTQVFIASGGSAPYTFSLLSGTGSVSSSGLYSAPSSRGVATIRVTDAAGTSIDALVITEVQLILSPPSRKANVNSTFQFSATGGTTPYTYTMTSGSSLVSSNGLFTASASAEMAVVRLTDANGYTTDATVIVGNGPVISPTTVDVPLSSTVQFNSTSGTPPLTYALVSGAGSINSTTGLYASPPTIGSATIKVTDANGFYSESIVSIFKRNQISTGQYHTCVLKGSTNAVRCWGNPATGVLGDGNWLVGDSLADLGDALKPVIWPSALTAQPLMMATTYYNGCAIFSDGLTRCWGYAGYGLNGNNQLTTGMFGDTADGILPVPADISNPIVDLATKSNSVNHQCGIYLDGTLKCWGYNYYGQLGQNNQIAYGSDYALSSLYAVNPIDLGQAVLKVDTGHYHTCALLADKNVKCWGYNLYGQLGLGHTNDIGEGPANEITGLSAHNFAADVIEISAGGYFNCVLLTGGFVRCWGYNAYGEAGKGDALAYGDDPGEDPTLLSNIDLGLGMTAVKIDSGDYHTCALLANAMVKCWGYNASGQLGLEDVTSRGSAIADMGDNLPFINLGPGRTAVDIYVGGYKTCAKLDDGTVKCWGNNEFGSLGIGLDRRLNQGDGINEMGSNLPIQSLGSSVTSIDQMSTFYSGTCGLVSEGSVKKIKCFGTNENGLLGTENSFVGDDAADLGLNTPVVDLGTNKEIADLIGGANRNCALFTDGTAKCWGYNAYNNLGTNGLGGTYVGLGANDMGTNLSYLISGPGLITKISSNIYGDYAGCIILDGTTLKCYGYNYYGALGTDDQVDQYDIPLIAPVNIGPALTPIDVSSGFLYTCAISSDRSVRCFGYNNFGQLGLGHMLDTGDAPLDMANNVLVDLGAGTLSDKICSGEAHNCVLTTDGKVKCWGNNPSGQLGIGHANNIGDGGGEMGLSLPFLNLGTGRTATKISCGKQHTCALLDNKKMKCWGYNGYGQLGYGHSTSMGISTSQMGDNLPYVSLGTGRTVLDIELGSLHTCALLDNNDVKCWGYNVYGGLGKGTTSIYGDEPGEMGDNLTPIDLP